MVDSRETVNKAFVIGFPIKHSRSPLIHSHWLKKMNILGSYTAISVQPNDIDSFFEELKLNKGSDYLGGNITIPHKEKAFKWADAPDEIAEELGAANTIWFDDGKLKATNTDGFGFLANIDQAAKDWDKTSKAIVLGAGGASRAIIQALRHRGISEIHVLNRTVARAQELADRFGDRIYAHSFDALPEVIKDAGLFVNTTSLGMNGSPVNFIDFSEMDEAAVVTDIVYVPLQTAILKMAAEQGFKTVDGLGMLLHQAVPGFEKWFGKRPVVDNELRNMIIADMENH